MPVLSETAVALSVIVKFVNCGVQLLVVVSVKDVVVVDLAVDYNAPGVHKIRLFYF